MTCATGLPLLACKASSRLQEGRDFTSWCPSNRARWDQVKTFTKTVAETMAKERPDRYVATMAKRARGARIFIDYLRNDRGATAVAAYSTRALPRAPVSTPLDWDELSPGLRSDHFTVGNLLHRLSSLKQDPWKGIFKICQRLPQFQQNTRL